MLSMANVRKSRGRNKSRHTFELRVPNMKINAGQAYGICGESGSGKSTFLGLAALALQPDSADVFTVAQDASTIDVMRSWRSKHGDRMARLRRESLGYVLQQGGLFGALSVRENIELAGRIRGDVDHNWMAELVERLGIADVLPRKPKHISIGQRQRTAIARALVTKPALIVADEPTASVDTVNGDRIFELFLELVRESGAALIVASHDLDRLRRPDIALYRHGLTEQAGTTISTLQAAA